MSDMLLQLVAFVLDRPSLQHDKLKHIGHWFLPPDLCYTSRAMTKSKEKTPRPVDNSVSDTTGAYDLRFVLWRQFCAKNNIPVDTLPSQLDDEQKELWEAMKQKRLK